MSCIVNMYIFFYLEESNDNSKFNSGFSSCNNYNEKANNVFFNILINKFCISSEVKCC